MRIEKLCSSPLGTIATSRNIVISTNATLIRISSGNRAMEIYNAGPTDFYYGGSTVLVNSGNVVSVSNYHFWDDVVSNFGIFCIANSVATVGVVNEYA